MKGVSFPHQSKADILIDKEKMKTPAAHSYVHKQKLTSNFNVTIGREPREKEDKEAMNKPGAGAYNPEGGQHK
jgi:hypothetical protein